MPERIFRPGVSVIQVVCALQVFICGQRSFVLQAPPITSHICQKGLVLLRFLKDGRHTDEVGAVIVILLQTQHRIRDVEPRSELALQLKVIVQIILFITINARIMSAVR